jgi:hypothetical protein
MKRSTPLIATPISHQFENETYGGEISEASDCLEVRERSLDTEWANQFLFHIDVDLTHEWNDEMHTYLSTAFNKKPHLRLITLQATRCCLGERLIDGMFQLEGKIYSAREMIDNSIVNSKWLREKLSPDTAIGLENNNYYPTPAYQDVTDGDFISEVLEENDLFLLLDIAHAMVAAHNKNLSYDQYIASLPLHRIIQLHICQPKLPVGGVAVDAHGAPDEGMFQEVLRLVEKLPNIKYLTIEYYKDKDILIESILHLRQLLKINNV